MKYFHALFLLYKTMSFCFLVSEGTKVVINFSCVLSEICVTSLGIPSNMKQERTNMKALLRVISLVVISVVVIIIPPCGAALGRGKA